MNIDALLQPYADEQPKQLSMNYTSSDAIVIERIPPIVDHLGVTDEFQTFYNKIVDAVTSMNVNSLWELSDKILTEHEFSNVFKYNWQDTLSTVLEQNSRYRGIDIELNLGRFQGLHRNLLGGFYIMTYLLKSPEYSTMFEGAMNLERKYTELLFTYKKGEFVILSKLDDFKSVED